MWIECEADDRHAIKTMQECAVMNVRASKTPATTGHADESCAHIVGSSLTDQEKSEIPKSCCADKPPRTGPSRLAVRSKRSVQAHGVTRGPRMGTGEKNRKVFEREAEGNPVFRIWKDCAVARWFHRLGSGWRTSEREVHIWCYLDVEWLLDQVVVQHSGNNRAQLSGGGIARNEQVPPARIISGERRL